MIEIEEMQKMDSFQEAFNGLLPAKYRDEVREQIMKIFDVTSYPAWLRRLRGEVSPSRQQAREVETLFSKYGIPKSKVWGK